MAVVYIANIFSQCITCLFTLFRLPLGKTKILDIVKFIYLLYVSQYFFCFKISFPTLRYKRYSHLFSAKVFWYFILTSHQVVKKGPDLIYSDLIYSFFPSFTYWLSPFSIGWICDLYHIPESHAAWIFLNCTGVPYCLNHNSFKIRPDIQ